MCGCLFLWQSRNYLSWSWEICFVCCSARRWFLIAIKFGWPVIHKMITNVQIRANSILTWIDPSVLSLYPLSNPSDCHLFTFLSLSPQIERAALRRFILSHFDKHTALVLALTASTSTSMTIATPLHCCCEACEHGVPGPRLGRHPKESRIVQINAPYYGAMHHTMVLV